MTSLAKTSFTTSEFTKTGIVKTRFTTARIANFKRFYLFLPKKLITPLGFA